MGVTKESFGVTCKGDKVTLYKITNANGLVAEVIDFGAIICNQIASGEEEVVFLLNGFGAVEGTTCTYGKMIAGRSESFKGVHGFCSNFFLLGQKCSIKVSKKYFFHKLYLQKQTSDTITEFLMKFRNLLYTNR